MKCSLLLCGAAALLASCAPSVTGPVVGRIVNSKTGAEGQVSFTRGTLKPRLGDPFSPDNAVIAIGGQTYTGRTVLIDGGAVRTPSNWDMSFGFGGGRAVNDGFFGWGTRLNTPQRTDLARTGNLIAKTAGANPSVLTCTLTVDVYEHGVGDCTDSSGTKYAMQF